MNISAKQMEVMRQSTNAVVKYLDNISVAIIGTDKNQKPKEIGSGTCIRIGDKFFISTAAHCIKSYQKGELFLIHTKLPKERDIVINEMGYHGGDVNDLLDIGWLELTEENANKLQKTFIELNDLELDFSHIEDDVTLVSGFPSELIQKFYENRILSVTPIGYQTISLDPSTIGSSVNVNDIFFDYPNDGNIVFDDRANELPEAYGISGGGFWSLHVNTDGIWSTKNIKLIGIDRSWSTTKRWIKGNQINSWLDMIIEDFQFLANDINKIFPSIGT